MNITSITVNFEDGTTASFVSASTVAAPTAVEVDVVESDGSAEKFTPKAPAPDAAAQ